MVFINKAYDGLKQKYAEKYPLLFTVDEQVADIAKLRDFELTDNMKHGN